MLSKVALRCARRQRVLGGLPIPAIGLAAKADASHCQVYEKRREYQNKPHIHQVSEKRRDFSVANATDKLAQQGDHQSQDPVYQYKDAGKLDSADPHRQLA